MKKTGKDKLNYSLLTVLKIQHHEKWKIDFLFGH